VQAERACEVLSHQDGFAAGTGRFGYSPWELSGQLSLQLEAPATSRGDGEANGHDGEISAGAVMRSPTGGRPGPCADDRARKLPGWTGAAARIIEVVESAADSNGTRGRRHPTWTDSGRGASGAQHTSVEDEDAAARERVGLALHESIAERSRGIVRPGPSEVPRLGKWVRRFLTGSA
jgi:hypothetical protein